MKAVRLISLFLSLLVVFASSPAIGGQAELEKDLQASLKECSRLVQQIKRRFDNDKPTDRQMSQLARLVEEFKVSDLLMRERHRLRLDKAGALGGRAVERQSAMAERYRQAMEELLTLLQQLQQAGDAGAGLIPQIENLLEQFIPKQQLPIHGVLPYRQLDYSVVTPVFTPTVVPAYQAGLTSSVSADLAGAPEAPVSKLIADQAKAIAAAAGTQNWDPVAIYEWVKNNIQTEWYFGVMKGAEETLRQGSGNDADQAALLVALLRASDYPARYVRGVVEFFPGIDAVKSLVGIEDPAVIGDFFRKAGIPHQPVMNGQEIVNYQIEHVWVESLIPYANYRGAMADQQGKIWLPLDTSIKVAGYDEAGDLDVFTEVGNPLSTIRDNYLGAGQTETPLDYLKSEVDTFLASVAPGTLYDSVLHTRTLRDETLRILPSAPQFTEIAVTGEYTSLPSELVQTVNIQASTAAPESLPIFDALTLPVYQLSNQQMVISFEPETVEDQEIINSWGGLDNTPGYLVRLRPVLKVNDERILVGQEGVAVGGQFDLTFTLNSPAGNASFSNTVIAGYPLVTGIVAQDAVLPDPASLQTEVTDLLYNEAINYIDRWNRGEAELSQLLKLNRVRPVPTVATVGGAMEVVELLGEPQGITWKGLFLDADLRVVETIDRSQAADEREKLFMQLSALEGSVLEGQVFKDAFDVESISTAKLFGLANDNLLNFKMIDAANVDVEVPLLPFADNIKADITDAVAQGLTVQIPDQALAYLDWTGIGYIKENLVTGEAGYMLSGQIAGGMTAITPDNWLYPDVHALQNPGLQETNEDPLSAVSIHKLSGSDYQVGAAGEELNHPLTVLVRDAEGRPVVGALVTFSVAGGGGQFGAGLQSVTVNTDMQGMARTQPGFRLGQSVLVDTTTYAEPGYEFASYARENYVAAELDNGTSIEQDFVAIAIPGAPAQMTSVNSQVLGGILQYAGEVGASLSDQYGNPVANVPVQFAAGAPTPWQGWCNVADANQAKLDVQLTTEESCIRSLPSWDECAVSGNVIGKTWTNGVVSAGVVMGSYPDGKYPVTASYAGPTLPAPLTDLAFTAYTTEAPPGGLCGGHTPPTNYLSLHSEDNLLRVRPAGVPVTVRAKAEMVAEGIGAELGSESFDCGGENQSCPQLQGNHAFDFAVPDALSLSFNGSTGALSVSDPDMYEAAVTLGIGDNNVAVHAQASRTINLYQNDCAVGCATQAEPHTSEYSADWAITYTGVAIEMPDVVTIKLNGGYPLADIPVDYTIQPLDYNAVSASFLIYEEGNLVYAAPSTDTTGANTDYIPAGFWFDQQKKYTIQTVLNYNWGEAEIWSQEVPVVFADQTSFGQAFDASRTHIISQFDDNVTTLFNDGYVDRYREFPFTLAESANVKVSILDSEHNEQAVLVPATAMAAGDYYFVVDYSQITAAGFSIFNDHEYIIQYEQVNDSDGRVIKAFYPGRLSEQTSKARMLGQTIVHDVLLQDGSLNLTRTDLSVQGRGPDFSFTRSYNNQFASEDHNPLGNGWSHSLDLRLRLLSYENGGNGAVPDWVTGLKGTFYTAGQVPDPATNAWDQIQVNGSVFRRVGATWYAQRGNHGTLTAITGGFRFTAKDGTQYDYDVQTGTRTLLVSQIADRNGNPMQFTYGPQNRLEKVTDAVGREFLFTYELKNVLDEDPYRLVSIAGPDSLSLTFTYDQFGNLITAERGERVETYEYVREPGIVKGDFNLIKVVDANGHATHYEYHAAGEVDPNLNTHIKVVKDQDIIKQVVYADNNFAAFQYDGTTGNKRTVTDLRGFDTLYTLNTYGNPIRIDEPLGKYTVMTWSIDESKPDNVMTSKTVSAGTQAAPRSLTTTYEYDANGNVTKETDPYLNFVQSTWNAFSQPLTRIDRNGVEQIWTYDDPDTGVAGCLLSHQIEVEPGVFKQTGSTCYATGEVETVTDPRGNVTRTTYDIYGNPDLVTVAEGTAVQAVTDFDFDIRGRKAAVTDARGNRTVYAYDDLDYPASVTFPARTSYALPAGSTSVKLTDYDALGNLLSETDRTGLTLTYTYTERNQVENITRSAGVANYGRKTFGYDANGNLTSETDWKGVATTHTYDALNRRDTTTNRLGDGMSMGYDLAGNLIQVTDYEGRITDYQYDDLNRQTRVIQPLLPGQAARGEIVTTYYLEADPETNLETVTDAEQHTTRFEYNGRYQKTKKTSAVGELDYVFEWQYDDAGNLAKTIDEELNEIRFEYDAQNRRTFTYAKLDAREFAAEERQYDAVGNVRFVIDALGNSTETQYDEWNRAWKTITPVDTHASVSYTTEMILDGEGREVEVTSLAVTPGVDQKRSFLRDARGLVLTATDAEQQSTGFTYDLNDNLATVTNARGYVTRSSYDAEDRKLLTIEAEGQPEERTTGVVLYDKVGNATQVRDGNGNIFVTEFNALNLPWKQYDPAPFNAQYVETLYDKNGRPVSMTNRRGYTTTTSYDALGRVDTVIDPVPFETQTIVTTYDKVGNVRTVKDKRGIISETQYDDLYRVTNQLRDSVRLLTSEYDDAGNMTATVDAENNRVEYTYNSRNLLERTTYIDPDGTDYFTEQFYDGVGNVVSSFNEEAEETVSTFDKENRLKTVTFAGETTESFYDAVGNLERVLKPEGNDTTRTFDALNRLQTATEGGLLTTTYTYDANDNLRTIEDPRTNTVEYSYDELNRKTAHIQHKASGNLTISYDLYDAEGNLTQMTDAKGQVFTYDYDELNRLTLVDHPLDAATPFLAIDSVVTSYDANNNVATVTETKQIEGGGTQTDVTGNSWDNFDRLDDTTQRGITIDYAYDNNGNRTLVATTNGSTIYSYDHRNRLETVVVGGTETTTYSYTPDGLTDTVTYPNGATADYDYWPTNRVQTITHTDSAASTISRFNYLYDQNGNRTQQVEEQGGTTETTTYVYRALDNIDRLESFTVTDGVTTSTTDYTFEGYNRKTEQVTVDSVLTVDKTYVYDETNWLDSVTDAISSAVITYSYDNNGNTTLKSDSSQPGQDMVFTYDVANRLMQTEQGVSLLGRYDYNPSGMRVRHYGSERGDVEYYYDDGAVLEEYIAGAGGGLLAHYRYGDRLLSLDTGTETQYYHHDALGSTVNLTDGAGLTKVRYTLDPWGHIRSQFGTSVNRQIFTGQEHDENTGLIYFGARYYDPDTGRFISQDSYLGELGTPPSLHRYLYAYGNPTVFIDLYGYISNREMMGLDEDSVNQALLEDSSLSNVMWLTAKSSAYTLWNGITGGFVARQDERQEAYDRGKLTEDEFWAGTTIDGGVSIAAQVVGGGVGGKVYGKVAGATGSKMAATFVAGATDSAIADIIEQSGQVAVHEVTDGKLGQEQIDLKQTAVSAASGAVVSTGLYAGKETVSKITTELRNGWSNTPKKIGPIVPDYHKNNFNDGSYTNRQVNGDEVFFKYHGSNNRLGKTHNYVTKKRYSNENDLRDELAILDEWGIDIDRVTMFKPAKGTWISEGTAKAQSADFKDEIRPGGGYQGLIDVNNLPKNSIVRTEKLPKGFK